ncbi:MAG: PD-(D/E)XK nuclease family protein [Deltaproteobacteria bacterium]|nr:PD-(D/E)XK nuclease family protein [Deltaproteobacteria bacterium]MBW2418150.1 PD-(D/E)XK nuclease family protein [Deltaproteobacteria bacterium]
MPTLYSHSRLSSFENCPKQFHFRYVLKVPQESEGIEAFMGKRVHEVLERLYVFARRRQIPSIGKVVARYYAFWEEHFDEERVRIVRRDRKADSYRELGARCLEGYYQRHFPFDGDETLAIEERVIFELDSAGRYRMQGIIDRLVRDRDGTVEIHDYKTGRYLPPQKQLDVDRQLALYQIGLEKRFGPDQPMRLVWHYLQQGKRVSSTRSPEQLDALRADTIGVIERVEAEEEFSTRRGKLCDWCEYKVYCPEFGGSLPPSEARTRKAKPPNEKAAPGDDQLDLV